MSFAITNFDLIFSITVLTGLQNLVYTTNGNVIRLRVEDILAILKNSNLI